jgi:hypothetical protein
MLKQINDTILVTGPFKINGVPLRRINPAYVIATSTKLDLGKASGLSLDKFNEAYFKVKKEKKGKSTEEEFFGEAAKVHHPSCCNFNWRRRRWFQSRGRQTRKRWIKLLFRLLQRHHI